MNLWSPLRDLSWYWSSICWPQIGQINCYYYSFGTFGSNLSREFLVRSSCNKHRFSSLSQLRLHWWFSYVAPQGGKCLKCEREARWGSGAGKTLRLGKKFWNRVLVILPQFSPYIKPLVVVYILRGSKWSFSMKFEHHRDMSGCRSVDCVKS